MEKHILNNGSRFILLLGILLLTGSWKAKEPQVPADPTRLSQSFIHYSQWIDTVPSPKKSKIVDLDIELEKLEEVEAHLNKALKEIDWDKLERELSQAIKNIDIKKIEHEINLAIRELDKARIELDIKASLSKIDWEEIKNEIKKVKEIELPKIEIELNNVKENMKNLKPEIEKELENARKELEKAKKELKEQ
ncbi:MAG: hypothetical protein H0V30_02030 [Chitinophagaceae bacterium]|jgi:hypothetical protein|nr:hypothetical protein [Chitinophagaceae bacterium]